MLWLAYIGILTLCPDSSQTARICTDAAPRLTTWALVLAVPGYLSLGMLVGSDHLLWSVSDAGLSGADAVAVVDAGHPLDRCRDRRLRPRPRCRHRPARTGAPAVRPHPGLGGWAIAVSQPLHFVATVILGSPQVDFVAWSLTAVGMAFVAREVLRDR